VAVETGSFAELPTVWIVFRMTLGTRGSQPEESALQRTVLALEGSYVRGCYQLRPMAVIACEFTVGFDQIEANG